MKGLQDFLAEALVLEMNVQIFPKPGQGAKMAIRRGDHCARRQAERNVPDYYIIDAMFGAFNDIRDAWRKGKIDLAHGDGEGYFVITDGRDDDMYRFRRDWAGRTHKVKERLPDGGFMEKVVDDMPRSRQDPVCLAVLLNSVNGNDGRDTAARPLDRKRFSYPVFTIKTVFKGDGFSGSLKGGDRAYQIVLS